MCSPQVVTQPADIGPREVNANRAHLCVRVLILQQPSVLRPERSAIPLRGRSFGSHHLPWALPRILQTAGEIKRRIGGRMRPADRGDADACLRDAISSFTRGKCASAIAVSAAGKRRGDGRGGKPSSGTAAQEAAKRNETGRAGATGSVSGAGKYQVRRLKANPRG
jgi:hypothetical protein